MFIDVHVSVTIPGCQLAPPCPQVRLEQRRAIGSMLLEHALVLLECRSSACCRTT